MSEPAPSATPTSNSEGKPTLASPPKETVTTDKQMADSPPKKDDTKPVDPPKDDKPKSVDYDAIKVPDGTDANSVKKFKEWAKGLGLNLEQAQKLFDEQRAGVENMQKAQKEAFQKQIDADIAAIEADPKLGGENYDKTILTARRGLQALMEKKVVSDGFVAKLEKRGLHVDPDIVKILHYLGEANSEPKSVVKGTVGVPDQKKPLLARSVAAFTPKH